MASGVDNNNHPLSCQSTRRARSGSAKPLPGVHLTSEKGKRLIGRIYANIPTKRKMERGKEFTRLKK